MTLTLSTGSESKIYSRHYHNQHLYEVMLKLSINVGARAMTKCEHMNILCTYVLTLGTNPIATFCARGKILRMKDHSRNIFEKVRSKNLKWLRNKSHFSYFPLSVYGNIWFKQYLFHENYIHNIYISYKSEQDLITSIKTYTIINQLLSCHSNHVL